jgi:hypothetical protein
MIDIGSSFYFMVIYVQSFQKVEVADFEFDIVQRRVYVLWSAFILLLLGMEIILQILF